MAMIQIADEYWVEESTISRLVRENGKNMLYFKGGQSMEVESFYVQKRPGACTRSVSRIRPMANGTKIPSTLWHSVRMGHCVH